MFESLKKSLKDINLKDIKNKVENIDIKELKNNIHFPKNNATSRVEFIKNIMENIEDYEGNLEEKIVAKIEDYYDSLEEENSEESLFINDFLLSLNNKENVILEFSKYLKKQDIYLLKKVYVTEDYSELKKLTFKPLTELDKIQDSIVMKSKINNLNYKTILFIVEAMEEYIEKTRNNTREDAFFYGLRKYAKEVSYLPLFFDIINRFQNKEYLSFILSEIEILPKDFYDILFESETIERGSRFYLLKDFCKEKLKGKEDQIFDFEILKL